MTGVDGRPAETVPVTDRGLLYGDGLFETIRFDAGVAGLWERHLARLRRDAGRIGLALPDARELLAACRGALGEAGSGVVRLTVTRGDGAGGYTPPEGARSRWIVTARPGPAPTRRRLRAIACTTTVSVNPSLAGMKHLGRLEQILAAREVRAAGADEGLVFRPDRQLVEGVSGNVFVLLDERWRTPPVDEAGVAGVYRAWLLDHAPVGVATIPAGALERARAIFVANAVRGMEAVALLGQRALEVAPVEALRDAVGEPWPAGA